MFGELDYVIVYFVLILITYIFFILKFCNEYESMFITNVSKERIKSAEEKEKIISIINT